MTNSHPTQTREAMLDEAVRRVRDRHGLVLISVEKPCGIGCECPPLETATPALIAAIRSEYARVAKGEGQ